MNKIKTLLKVSSINLSTLNKELIKKGEMTLIKGSKKALIGRNGSGKTTLLKALFYSIRKKEIPDYINFSAEISINNNTSVGYVPQEIDESFQGTIGEFIDLCLETQSKIFYQYKKISKNLGNKVDFQTLEEYSNLVNLMTKYDLWNYEDKKKELLHVLGLSNKRLFDNYDSLSGGEATKLGLLIQLLQKPDILFLDEPTNYLDEKQMLYLSNDLKKSTIAILFVSHDRLFIDNVAQSIYEINEDDLSIHSYGGNYTFYKEQKDCERQAQMRIFNAQTKKIKKLQESFKRINKQAKEIESISANSFIKNKGAKLAKGASKIKKKLLKEIDNLKEPEMPSMPAFVVNDDSKYHSRRNVINCEKVSFKYQNNSLLINDFNMSFYMGERWAITGPNGIGKSTLLKLLIGKLKPTSGSVEVKGKVGYLPQIIENADSNKNPIDIFTEITPMAFSDAQRILGKVLFYNASLKRIKDFSTGELKKIYLAAIFTSNPDIIALDEPTNHLDIFSIEMLEKALNQFKGTIILVTHDRTLINNLNAREITLPSNLMLSDKIV